MEDIKHVVLSAGHTDRSPGAISGALREHDLNWKVVCKLAVSLWEQGFIVTVLPKNWKLSQKVKWANAKKLPAGETLFLEVHHNAFNGSAHGTECFYTAGDLRAHSIGTHILSALVKTYGLRNRGMKLAARSARGSLGWLRIPTALLLEVCFMDNPDDLSKIKGFSHLGRTLCNALVKSLKG